LGYLEKKFRKFRAHNKNSSSFGEAGIKFNTYNCPDILYEHNLINPY